MILFDYCVYAYLQMVFGGPARMIASSNEMEQFVKHFSLNGIKIPTICKQ